MKNVTLNFDASALRALQNAVAPPSDTRNHLHYIRLDLANGYAVAIDGSIMVEYPLALSNDASSPGYRTLAAEYPEGLSIALDKKVPASWGTVRLDFSTARAQGDKPAHTCGFRVLNPADTGAFPNWRWGSAHQDKGNRFAPNRSTFTEPLCFNPSILQKVTEKALVLVELPDPSCDTSAYRVTPIDRDYLVTFMPARPPES